MKEKIYKILKDVFRKYRNSSRGNIDYENAKMILKNDKNAILLDVRSPQEYRETHLEGSINIPLYNIEASAKEKIKNKEYAIIVYCQSGGRSRKAIEILKKMGYYNIYNIDGGLDSI